jgi:hypothetical protein
MRTQSSCGIKDGQGKQGQSGLSSHALSAQSPDEQPLPDWQPCGCCQGGVSSPAMTDVATRRPAANAKPIRIGQNAFIAFQVTGIESFPDKARTSRPKSRRILIRQTGAQSLEILSLEMFLQHPQSPPLLSAFPCYLDLIRTRRV